MSLSQPAIVGIGGTVRSDSTSEAALRVALASSQRAGGRIEFFAAADLVLPFYDPRAPGRSESAQRLLAALRAADGVIVSSPGYHGAISGLIKNALDYVEDMAGDDRAYLSGLPFGCIGIAYGSQAAVTVLANLRTIAHALRAFPTPYGAAIVAGPSIFDHGRCIDADTREQLEMVGQQVVELARLETRIHPARDRGGLRRPVLATASQPPLRAAAPPVGT
jgi:FMN reductase